MQAIGFEPQDIAHWSELIYVVGRNFKPQQRQNARALIEDPNEWVISEIRNFIDPILFDLAESDQVLPNPVKRLLGLLLSVAPKQPQIALNYLENLLEHFPADLLLLEAYAHLLASHGMKAAHSQNDKLNPLENILSAHAEAIDVMKQISLWGDLGTVRWAAGDYTGAMTAIENLFQLLPKENDDAAMSDQIFWTPPYLS